MAAHSRRRDFLSTALGLAAYGKASSGPSAIARPQERTGTLQDVAHVVILTQENRAFDHYFGSLRGVRGFQDRFPIPIADANGRPVSVMQQPAAGRSSIYPYHVDTRRNPAHARLEGTPHTWPDAQQAWDHGRLKGWVAAKGMHCMAHFERQDLPLHYALADAFTICDAYHCSFMGGTNPNRLFLWSGTNDPHALGQGPALYNELDTDNAPADIPRYTWTTYAERLQQAGVSWQIYQDMADNYSDNPLVGFASFRSAQRDPSDHGHALRQRALSTRTLADLQTDVLRDMLPQVSWVIAPATDSEHPDPSSPAQGAVFIAQLLRALWSNPTVWQRTVLLINYDENDGYFDHVPPPAVPSRLGDSAQLAGASTIDTNGEYHAHLRSYHRDPREPALLGRPYGLGARVPLIVASPWSRGGWVCSQVFDHTSILRFLERRFGVAEPNISPWRRAVCGDLTTALDFSKFDDSLPELPDLAADAARAKSAANRTVVPPPPQPTPPRQEPGVRPSRRLPYAVRVDANAASDGNIALTMANDGASAVVLHVYDRLDLSAVPRRYTVGAGHRLNDRWPIGASGYDLWLLGPSGFHRHFCGPAPEPGNNSLQVTQRQLENTPELLLELHNPGTETVHVDLTSHDYAPANSQQRVLSAGATALIRWSAESSAGWYDLKVRCANVPKYVRRLAGRLEGTWVRSSDPAQS